MLGGGRILLVACALTVAVASPPARAEDDPAPATSALDSIGALVEKDVDLQARYKVCPADIARTARPLWKSVWPSDDWSEEACGADLQACHNACAEWRDETACFVLARNFEDAQPAVSPHLSQMLFAEACALGSGGGCTNRGSGIRNGQFEGDPMLNKPLETLSSCFFQTFTISCGDGDAWGCTMLGQSYQTGEGVKRDEAEARKRFLKACDIDPDFAACDYARGFLDTDDREEE